MPSSMISAKNLDVGNVGLTRDDLSSAEQGPIVLADWFDPTLRANPVELEIGSGKGTFLIQHAPRHPKTNFIGIEYARAFWRLAADRVRRHHLSNVRLLYHDAAVFIRDHVADATFEQVHIYFPDPWPKARHHKRRLIQAPFLRELHRVLKPGGSVRIATDHQDYFAWMEEQVAKVTDIFERLPFESPDSAGEDEMVGSNFERKYRKEGRVFQGMILQKDHTSAHEA